MDITVGTIVKIILGILVIAAVAYGLYTFFTSRVLDSFGTIGINTTVKFLMNLY
jgi:hypothetical protein